MTSYEYEATRIAVVRFRAMLERKKLYLQGRLNVSGTASTRIRASLDTTVKRLARLERYWEGLRNIYEAPRWEVLQGVQACIDAWRTRRLARRCGIGYDVNGPDLEALLME